MAIKLLIPKDTSQWKTYTPNVTATAGAFGTVTATGRYKILGSTVFVAVKITITAIGSATGGVIVTLPVIANNTISMGFAGKESAVAGTVLFANINAGGTALSIYSYSGGGVIVNNYVLNVNGSYEIA